MTQKMQVAIVEEFSKPLERMELDITVAGPGQILVKTETCGVCHTDLHARNGDRPAKANIAAVAAGKPPRHLLLGNDAFDGAMARLNPLRMDFISGETVVRVADFAKSNAGAAG